MEIKITLDQKALDLIDQIPIMIRYKCVDQALKAMAKPIVERAKAIAPSSRKSGSRKKWGKNKTKHFDPAAWAQDDSGKHISSKVKRTQRGGILFVGATHPRGNKQQFLTPKAEQKIQYFWGKPGQIITRRGATFVNRTSPKVVQLPRAKRFIQRAFDETIGSQRAAFESTLQTAIQTQLIPMIK